MRPLIPLKIAYSLLRLVGDMNRTDNVFKISSTFSSSDILEPLCLHYARVPLGAKAFVEQPRLGPIDFETLSNLPDHSLGRTYAQHMLARKLNPNFFPKLIETDRYAFLLTHLYETHDLWHVVTGFDTDVVGELGLQAFYLAQAPMGPIPPAVIAAGLLNSLLYERTTVRDRMEAIARGWRMGTAAKPLFGVPWANYWETNVEEIRDRFDITIEKDIKAG